MSRNDRFKDIRANFQFDDMGNLLNFDGTPILLDGEVTRDPDVLSILEKYRPGIIALQQTVVGESKVSLNEDLPQYILNFLLY